MNWIPWPKDEREWYLWFGFFLGALCGFGLGMLCYVLWFVT